MIKIGGGYIIAMLFVVTFIILGSITCILFYLLACRSALLIVGYDTARINNQMYGGNSKNKLAKAYNDIMSTIVKQFEKSSFRQAELLYDSHTDMISCKP